MLDDFPLQYHLPLPRANKRAEAVKFTSEGGIRCTGSYQSETLNKHTVAIRSDNDIITLER